MADVIMKDLDKIKKEYGTKRRTVIENAEEVVYEEKKVEEMEVTFLMDRLDICELLTNLLMREIKRPPMLRISTYLIV